MKDAIGCLKPLLGLVLLIGLLSMDIQFLTGLSTRFANRNYVEVQATITENQVNWSSGTRLPTCETSLRYVYQIGLQPIAGVNDSTGSGCNYFLAWWLEKHPVGTKVQVYYDPEKPNRSVVFRGLQWLDLWTLLIFLALNLFVGRLLVKAHMAPSEEFNYED